MRLEIFINFDGNCREAIEFYAKVFKSEVAGLMTYSDAPQSHGYVTPEADRDRIMYAGVQIGNIMAMFSDAPANGGFVRGNNICPTITLDDEDEIVRLFNELKDGGKVYMPLDATFFSKMFGMVEDKFGVIWQISYAEQVGHIES